MLVQHVLEPVAPEQLGRPLARSRIAGDAAAAPWREHPELQVRRKVRGRVGTPDIVAPRRVAREPSPVAPGAERGETRGLAAAQLPRAAPRDAELARASAPRAGPSDRSQAPLQLEPHRRDRLVGEQRSTARAYAENVRYGCPSDERTRSCSTSVWSWCSVERRTRRVARPAARSSRSERVRLAVGARVHLGRGELAREPRDLVGAVALDAGSARRRARADDRRGRAGPRAGTQRGRRPRRRPRKTPGSSTNAHATGRPLASAAARAG